MAINDTTSYISGSLFCCLVVAVMVHRLECRFLLPNCLNILPHTSHLYGFTPVCVRMCMAKACFLPNDLPQMSQQCDFTPVCVRMCVVKVHF